MTENERASWTGAESGCDSQGRQAVDCLGQKKLKARVSGEVLVQILLPLNALEVLLVN